MIDGILQIKSRQQDGYESVRDPTLQSDITRHGSLTRAVFVHSHIAAFLAGAPRPARADRHRDSWPS